MSVEHRMVSLVHQGYMAGLNGEDPEDSKSREYELGWLAGYEDRDKGVLPKKYLGPCELPISRGSEVTIPKGIGIEYQGASKVALRAVKVKLHDVYEGVPAYIDFISSKTVVRPTEAQVLWAGSGGYWSRANLGDILDPPMQEEPK